jgi:quercetin dioxygenase-like cupin family protein
MFIQRTRYSLICQCAIAIALFIPFAAQAQAPSAHPSAATPRRGNAGQLMMRDLIGAPGKEVVMSTIVVPPGANPPPHRHDAQVFVYVLEGTVIMQVKGGPRVTLGPGGTFYESPTDIHVVSANASKTKPAKFLAILIKDKDKPAYTPVPPQEAH